MVYRSQRDTFLSSLDVIFLAKVKLGGQNYRENAGILLESTEGLSEVPRLLHTPYFGQIWRRIAKMAFTKDCSSEAQEVD